jgi:hypothetical protein
VDGPWQINTVTATSTANKTATTGLCGPYFFPLFAYSNLYIHAYQNPVTFIQGKYGTVLDFTDYGPTPRADVKYFSAGAGK